MQKQAHLSSMPFVAALFVGVFSTTPAMADYQEGLQMASANNWPGAIQEFEPLADEGHAPSQFSMGLIYQLGRGVARDSKEARRFYIMSAKQGYWPAYNNLGNMFLDGDGVKKNLYTALKLFSKAADNHAQAKNNLARMYENGWGTEKDIDMAMALYEESGDAGFIGGYYSLGKLYEEGLKVDRDENAAIKWYTMASRKNHKKSIERLKAMGAPLPE